jgi:hypothetical protein
MFTNLLASLPGSHVFLFKMWADSLRFIAICGDRNFAPRAYLEATVKNNLGNILMEGSQNGQDSL